MYPHHEEAIQNFIEKVRGNQDILAVVLGGSVAKGLERKDSDVDFLVIVSDEYFEKLVSEYRTAECLTEGCNYEGGYYDLKYFPKGYLQVAAAKGSEPTRNAFVCSRCVYSTDPEIDGLVAQIPVYPVHEKQDKIYSFLSAYVLNSNYNWNLPDNKDNMYMKAHTAAELVFYGLRLILVHNEKLFPSQRRLMQTVEQVEKKPERILALASQLLRTLHHDDKVAFDEAIFNFTDWGYTKDDSRLLARFVLDNEQWWWKDRPNTMEW